MSNNPTPGDIKSVVKNAIGPMDDYAMGYLNPVGTDPAPPSQGTGYIATMKLSVGTVKINEADILDEGTENIVSYDRCEAADANISQINMGTASSFCGLNGALWGYHLATAELPQTPVFTVPADGGKSLDVYDATPLLDATYRLFGTVDAQRQPPLPGAHVICANKSITVRGPSYAWAFIAIAIAEDPKESNLFIEDCGEFPARPYETYDKDGKPVKTVFPTGKQVKDLLLKHEYAVAKSVQLCGEDYGKKRYSKMFAVSRAVYAKPGEVGSALACAPYVLLAQNALPPKWTTDKLVDSDLATWQSARWSDKLPDYPYPDRSVVGAPKEQP
ncbi:histidine decarboxylase, pyruvoyl type [Streptomyces sp. NPDC005970]|uniref:histidine decarboxylase, pyruvoyl type n=1 Tax=Streptomyces sp. NPDC005970 TaxID=3156723 RepID=UPI0033BFF2FC